MSAQNKDVSMENRQGAVKPRISIENYINSQIHVQSTGVKFRSLMFLLVNIYVCASSYLLHFYAQQGHGTQADLRE